MALESNARIIIDEKLRQAGWLVQDLAQANASASQGVAIREFPLSTGEADYLLVVNGEAVGVIEAKKTGTTLSGIKEQSARYQAGLPQQAQQIRFLRSPLPFSYEATDVEIYFTNDLEPEPRSRELFHFHKPETLAEFLRRAPLGMPPAQYTLLRTRLRAMPPVPPAQPGGLRTCQFEAISRLEASLANNRPRALIQMATGSGKTFMTVASIARLLESGQARRVLFLVDRVNLAVQTKNEFQQYMLPESKRRFTDVYNIQRLAGSSADDTSVVHIATIQGLYAKLTGKPIKEEEESASFFAREEDEEEEPKRVQYNPALPIEYYDVIFVDECHRSIYSEWRPVLEYFDAFIVGLTATPENRAFAFFERNLVYEYSQAQSVADGVNVDYEVYHLRTQITEQGSRVARGNVLDYRNRATRARTPRILQEDLIYDARHVGKDVVAKDQIRKIIQTYRDSLFTELFPERNPQTSPVPKTVIFARDDQHAEDILAIVREEFGRGNDFAKKITYRVSGVRTEELINQFRNNYYPRIVISVDMISTGTDIRPLEALIFMRNIKSLTLFEQMRGRGCRTIDEDALKTVTPGASKTRYIIFDAAGVTRSTHGFSNPPLERRQSLSLAELLERVAGGGYDRANLLSLAGRLGRLARYVTAADTAELRRLGVGPLPELAGGLLRALDEEEQLQLAQSLSGLADPPASALAEARQQLARQAGQPFQNPQLCELILSLKRREEQVIDHLSQDRIIAQGYDEGQAVQVIESFRALMEQEENQKQIEQFERDLQRPLAVSSATGQPVVARELARPLATFNTSEIGRVWRAYQKLEASRVRGSLPGGRYLNDIIALIRYTRERETDDFAFLEPFQETVNRRFETWLNEQRQRQRAFTPDQLWWLERIRDRIVTDLQCKPEYLNEGRGFEKGGLYGALRDFGGERALATVLRELNERLLEKRQIA